MTTDTINFKSWDFSYRPRKILAIRLQALGDVTITLPYLQGLKNRLLETRIDFLTRKEVDDLPKSLILFHRVFSIGGGRNFKKQVLSAALVMPWLRAQRYDVIIDLQRNPLSRWIRKLLNPPCWSEFDRYSPISAGERTRLTIEATGLTPALALSRVKLRKATRGLEILRKEGWHAGQDLVVLNPAGCFVTKNWPLMNYVEFANLWLRETRRPAGFLVLGVAAMADRARILKEHLGAHLIDLVDRTSPSEAFAILQQADLVVSEDSGLMHMAWVAGAPTLALFGSSRSDWSLPLGARSMCLSSSDLSCGECMAADCRFEEVHCLTRYTPEMVFEKAKSLLTEDRTYRRAS